MIIQLSPQVRERNSIWYEIEHQKITATTNSVSDTFDFTDMPNGELQLRDDEGNDLIETELDENPIISAKKENGVLTVKIRFSIDIDEQDERLLFPEPMTLDEFNDLMDELVDRDSVEEVVENETEKDRDEDEVVNIEEVDF